MINQFQMRFNNLSSGEFIIYKQTKKTIPPNFMPHLKNKTLLRHVLYRQSIGMNTFIIVVGAVRTGKSYFSMKFCEEYMKESKKLFTIKDNCSFKIKKFLQWSMNNYDSAFMLDEIQLDMATRQWYEAQHRVFNEFCDIQGFRRNLAIMTLPNISFLDKHVRFLGNYIIQTIHQGQVKWGKICMDHAVGKGYIEWVGTYFYTTPTKKVVEDYEALKKKHNDEHLERSLEMLDELEKGKVKLISFSEIKRAYKLGVIDSNKFQEMMGKHGFDKDSIDILIESNQDIGNNKFIPDTRQI